MELKTFLALWYYHFELAKAVDKKLNRFYEAKWKLNRVG